MFRGVSCISLDVTIFSGRLLETVERLDGEVHGDTVWGADVVAGGDVVTMAVP